jgi:hypothetical protein
MAVDLRRLCEILADSDKHKEWLESLGYTVFGGCAWKPDDRENSAFVATVVKREAEALITRATRESDQRATEADDRIQELESAVARWQEVSFRPLGDNHHNAALCPYCGEPLRKATDELARLRDAVKVHHAARGHERCWENDAALYRAAGLQPGEPELPPRPEFRRRCQEYEAGQYGGLQPAEEAIDDAPWADMLAQAEAVFRNVLETSPVLAELRIKLDTLQCATARTIVAERIIEAGMAWLGAEGTRRRRAERELSEAIREADPQQTTNGAI